MQIREILEKASIPEAPKNRAISAFHRLGVVEAGIHGVGLDAIHFHEVGAVDSIIDITGYFLGLHILGIERVAASPLPVGRGFVQCAHGRMPVPAPATAKLLEGIPVAESDLEGEVLTPTGALLLGESAEFFGPMPEMTITRVGYGAGDKDQPNTPNAVRAFLGETEESTEGEGPPTTIAVLEANIDDMSPELFPHVIEGALKAGALDAFSIPVTGQEGKARATAHGLKPSRETRRPHPLPVSGDFDPGRSPPHDGARGRRARVDGRRAPLGRGARQERNLRGRAHESRARIRGLQAPGGRKRGTAQAGDRGGPRARERNAGERVLKLRRENARASAMNTVSQVMGEARWKFGKKEARGCP